MGVVRESEAGSQMYGFFSVSITWMLVKEVLLNKVDNFPSEGIVKSPEFSPV